MEVEVMIQIEIDQQGIASIVWDMPGNANVLNTNSVAAFSEAIEAVLANPELKGAVVLSAKDNFILGGDINALYALKDIEEVMKLGGGIHKVFRRMETGGKPFAAVIHGLALGGGMELCLACHYRIATNHRSTLVGFPEVNIGLFPGAGGTQRLPRLIGLQPALIPLLQAKQYTAGDALKMGMVNEVGSDKDEAIQAAKQWILKGGSAVQPWDVKGFEVKGGDLASVDTTFLYAGTAGMVRQMTGGNYPAPVAILSCLYEGLQMNFDQAIDLELRYFAKVALSKQAKHMMRTLWFAMNHAKSGGGRPKGQPVNKVKKLGILGAGMMGAGIAYVAARSGIETVLKDVNEEQALKGKEYSAKLFADQIAKGRATQAKADETLSLITATGDATKLYGADLIIEAVFEDRGLKAKVTQEAEAQMDPGGVFASNTSTLPISSLAEASVRPHMFIGQHFFSPVDKMQLVEVIMGKQSSDEALARSIDFIQQIKKVPIVVNDSRGFYTSRIFKTFVTEGFELLMEGVKPALIENAGKASGMPVGPLAVADEVSLELLYKIRKQYEKDGVTEQGALTHVVKVMVEDLQRLGRKSGAGFYEYPSDGKKSLWKALGQHFSVSKDQPSLDLVKKRILHVQALESYRCLEEGVLRNVSDGDIGSILGWGFPPYTGGALSYIDFVGGQQFVYDCDEFASKGALRFSVPDSLRKMAEEGRSIHHWNP